MPDHIAFIGLGQLGNPIAANLARGDHAVRAYDPALSAEARQTLSRTGIVVVDDLADAVDGAVAVLTVLPTSAIVRSIMTSRTVLGSVAPGALFIDLSSGYPPETVEIGAVLADAGFALVDAPICKGGVGGARSGEMTLILGGAAAAKERARALLAPTARTILDAGPLGAGHTVKLVSNLIANAVSPLVAEAVALGTAGGVERHALPQLIEHCAPSVMLHLEAIIPDADVDLRGPATFRADLAAKDLGYASTLAARLQVPHFFADAAQSHYLLANRDGYGGLEAKRAPWLSAFGPPQDRA